MKQFPLEFRNQAQFSTMVHQFAIWLPQKEDRSNLQAF